LIFLLYQTDQGELVVPIQNLCKVLGSIMGTSAGASAARDPVRAPLYGLHQRFSRERTGPGARRPVHLVRFEVPEFIPVVSAGLQNQSGIKLALKLAESKVSQDCK